MPKKKTASRKKNSSTRKAAGRETAAKKAAPKQRAASRKAAPTAQRKKKIKSRPASRPRPVPPGNGQAPQSAGDDEHGPMHIPSHKPTPAYAGMHKNDWAGKPPTHDIPIPKH